jgi:hypothetical protein
LVRLSFKHKKVPPEVWQKKYNMSEWLLPRVNVQNQ